LIGSGNETLENSGGNELSNGPCTVSVIVASWKRKLLTAQIDVRSQVATKL
jgi:hypothetical protein